VQSARMTLDLWTLADCIAMNREIAGFHYPSDTQGGVDLANGVYALLKALGAKTRYQQAITAANTEWAP
jgi:hypothetical protein